MSHKSMVQGSSCPFCSGTAKSAELSLSGPGSTRINVTACWADRVCVGVCECVCERERERTREKEFLQLKVLTNNTQKQALKSTNRFVQLKTQKRFLSVGSETERIILLKTH